MSSKVPKAQNPKEMKGNTRLQNFIRDVELMDLIRWMIGNKFSKKQISKMKPTIKQEGMIVYWPSVSTMGKVQNEYNETKM